MCTKAAQTHVGVNRFQPRASVRVKPSFWGRSPNWQGVQAASEGSNMLPRKLSKCLQEWSNRATGGEAEEREICVRAVLGEAAISMAQARNNLQWQQWNFDCSTQSKTKTLIFLVLTPMTWKRVFSVKITNGERLHKVSVHLHRAWPSYACCSWSRSWPGFLNWLEPLCTSKDGK